MLSTFMFVMFLALCPGCPVTRAASWSYNSNNNRTGQQHQFWVIVCNWIKLKLAV